ncbi:unnamed protein product [Mytilus edulis]|uniref:DUF6589 domain-containing protein n=1 Tax=Mytilus edulis TaxID=6550 RepID=A0A8S3S1R2_MYTED|nr:unnamed protein product [Mytilus edulis]
MYYSDVVDILDSYEKIVETTFNAAGKEVTDDVKIHIGGDQLTRERFSGAKGLRAAENNVKNRFGHLTPVTFEMFHLLMNFLQGFFDFLYSDKSAGDLRTLKCEINKVMRSQVDQDVKKAYDADKDFVIAFVNAYIVELLCERFGMEDHLSVPTKNIPPEFSSVEEKKTWMNEVIGKLVDEMVWPKKIADIQNDVIGKHKYIIGWTVPISNIEISNGTEISICPKIRTTNKKSVDEGSDKVKNYGHLVLELGMLFKELLGVCKSPDRNQMLRLLKHSMTVFKASSNNSKYALEIHRFLIQQISTLSENEAAEVVTAMFVNTKGQLYPC